jgi:hypothetical protein
MPFLPRRGTMKLERGTFCIKFVFQFGTFFLKVPETPYSNGVSAYIL